MSTIKPSATGSDNVISGMRGLFTVVVAGEPAFADVAAGVKVFPQTRQRVAFSLKRVPQVGHTFEVDLVSSGLIGTFC